MKLISIVTPCFNEEDGISDCYYAVKSSLMNLSSKYSFEHIFFDNASTDNTFSILTKLASNDSSVKVIRNSRNYGIFKNAYNGVLNANGDAVLLMLPLIYRTHLHFSRILLNYGKVDIKLSTALVTNVMSHSYSELLDLHITDFLVQFLI